MVEIPLVAYPSRTFQIILDNQNCTCTLYQKGVSVYLNVSIDTQPVTVGSICCINTSLIMQAQHMFKGYLFFIDTLGNAPPLWEGLGDRWRLLYYTMNEKRPKHFMI